MNYELLNNKMNAFFEETSGAELIEELEKVGYTFVDSGLVKWKGIKVRPFTTDHLHFYQKEEIKSFLWRKPKILKKQILLSSNYGPEELRGLFFLKIAL